MPEFDLQLVLFLGCVGAFTIAAAVWDLRTRRIPNKLTIPVLFLGLAYQAVFNRWEGLADAGLAFLAGFGTLLILWLIGGGGGGDVKLMGALSVWLGFRMTLMVLIASTVFVLVGSLGAMVWMMITRGPYAAKRRFAPGSDERNAKQSRENQSANPRQNRRVMAFAMPVALATWLVVAWDLLRVSS